MGISSTSGVADLVNKLQEKGIIRRAPRQARALEVIGDKTSDVLDFMPSPTREQVQDYAQRHSITAEKAVAEICQMYLAGRVG
jgi:SOS-response transcriptional repressor LexA